LTLGEGLTGNLSALKFYNWNSTPLLTFADGSTSLNHTLQSVEESIEVVGTGALNQNSEQLQMLRVGFSANQQQSFVGVVSKDFFSDMMVFYSETNKPDGYPGYGAYNQHYTPFPFISVAHAWDWDYLMEKAASVLIAAIGLAIPYEEAIALYKQIRALADGEDVDYMDMTLNALAVISVVPGAQLLKPLSKGLKAFLPTIRANGKFFKAIGGILSKMGDDVLNRRFDTVMTLLPFLLVIGEMVADSEAREGAMLMFSSIASADDILAWAEYFSLPADGWDGDGEPPPVDTDGTAAVTPYFAYPFMAQAHAARNLTARRSNGKDIGQGIAELVRRNADLLQNPTLLSTGIRGITAGVKQTTYKSIRAMAHSQFMMQATVRVLQGARSNVQALIKGRPDQRVRPEIILACILYLETNKGSLFITDPNNRGDSLIALYELYARLLVDKNEPWAEKQYHGAAFHLMMLTYYHMSHQVGQGQPAVKAIEAVRPLAFGKSGIKYDREVDIVLALPANKERFVELKSMRRPAAGPNPLSASFFRTWQFGSGAVAGGQHLHKEFFTDWVQANNVDAKTKVEMAWRFHTFVSKDKRVRGPLAANMHWVKDRLCKMPSGVGSVSNWLESSTKKTTIQLQRDCENNADVQVQHARAVVNDFVRNGLFGDVGEVLEDLLQELMEE
ncbi:MAG: hypothetical protein KKE94_05190, partial [Gammaproteobacteria bacterium]|nr:hypothetical protein [Gammaproteobacteria bacterium]